MSHVEIELLVLYSNNWNHLNEITNKLILHIVYIYLNDWS